MHRISLDASTGFISEEELVQLAEPPESAVADAAVNATTAVCAAISAATAVSTVASAFSSAWGDGCPTTACSKRC